MLPGLDGQADVPGREDLRISVGWFETRGLLGLAAAKSFQAESIASAHGNQSQLLEPPGHRLHRHRIKVREAAEVAISHPLLSLALQFQESAPHP